MKEVEEIVYRRIAGDNGTGGILHLLGETLTSGGTYQSTRVLHTFQVATPPSPGLTFGIFSAPKGSLPRFTREVFVTFNIYAQNYSEISFRLLRLFDGIRHSVSVISGGSVQVGGVSSVFDFEGPDGYNDQLSTQQKDMRFRFFAVTKAQNPI